MKIQDTSARSGLIRALIAVCLLGGVFAMHGLTGNHDAAAALTHAREPASAPSAASMHPASQPPVHAAHRRPHSPPSATAPLTPPAVPLPGVTVQPAQDGHGHTMGDVCLAMLTALALAIAGALASHSLRTTRPAMRLRSRLTPMAMGPSPPWLQPTLSKLCVLRT